MFEHLFHTSQNICAMLSIACLQFEANSQRPNANSLLTTVTG